MLLRLGRGLLVAAYAFLVALLLLFSMFEFFPRLLDVVNLQSIAYYALKREFISDPSLVFVPRQVDYGVFCPTPQKGTFQQYVSLMAKSAFT